MRYFSKLACPRNFFREAALAHCRKPHRTCGCRLPLSGCTPTFFAHPLQLRSFLLEFSAKIYEKS